MPPAKKSAEDSEQRPLVRVVCWNRDLALERAAQLESARFKVDASPLSTTGLIRHIMANPPAAIVIDLDRMPSHGRAVAVVLRRSASARHIPLVFAGGPEPKVERIRQEIPDAAFTAWSAAASAIRSAVKSAPAIRSAASAGLVIPKPLVDAPHNTPLVRKLGLKPNMICALIQPPDDFAETLDDLPEGVEFQPKIGAATGLAIWFVRTRAEVELAVDRASLRLPAGASIWFVYPKQSGRISADFTQNDLRDTGLAVGLVDYKVCAVDADWTGLKFARRKQ